MTFQEYIDQIQLPNLPNPLPLIHSTSFSRLEQMTLSGEIKTTPCPNFSDDPLIYCFYGRAAYVVKKPEDENDFGYKFSPVAFIISNSSIDRSIKRIFPFDTGALFKGISYDALELSEATLGDMGRYSISTSVSALQRMTAMVWGGNENFIAETALPLSESSFHDSAPVEVKNYFNHLRQLVESYDSYIASSTPKPDRRAYTPEVQIQTPIALSKASISAIVLPPELEGYEVESGGKKLNDIAKELCFYEDDGMGSIANYHNKLLDRVDKFTRAYFN